MQINHPELVQSYHATYASRDGQRVLQHLVDSIYCTVYYGTEPNECLAHNARRAVVHEVLENIDAGERPEKYNLAVQIEEYKDATR